MQFTGLLLREGLQDTGVLSSLQVTDTETWNVSKPADFQPKVWTAITFEGKADQADEVAERLSRAIKPHWYANMSTGEHAYVIFMGRVFKYMKGDREKRAEAQAYALSAGVPAWQLDWGE